jgi:hypothetical protein
VLIATSAGVGALAQRVSTAIDATPAVTVVPEIGAFGIQGIDHSGTTAQCLPTRSRVVLLEFRFRTSPCTNPPVLVSDRSRLT